MVHLFMWLRPRLGYDKTYRPSNGWYIYDNKRDPFGTLVDAMIYANLQMQQDDGSRI